VRSGEEASDPRVAALDLRGRLHCMRVSVALPAGALPAGTEPPFAVLHVRHSSAEDYRGRWVQGSFVVATGAPSVDLVLDASGWRLERLAGVDSDRSVTLRPGLPVRIQLHGGAPALPAGFELRAELVPMVREVRSAGYRMVAFDAGGTALVRASEPGAHRAVIAAYCAATEEDYLLPADAFSPSQLDVAEGDGVAERVVPVDLDGAALARLIEKVSKERRH